VAQADANQAPGTIGALLRREGLYSSQLATWRRVGRQAFFPINDSQNSRRM
jgi:hypothetical protein